MEFGREVAEGGALEKKRNARFTAQFDKKPIERESLNKPKRIKGESGESLASHGEEVNTKSKPPSGPKNGAIKTTPAVKIT